MKNMTLHKNPNFIRLLDAYLPLAGGTMTGQIITTGGNVGAPGIGIGIGTSGFFNVANNIVVGIGGASIFTMGSTFIRASNGAFNIDIADATSTNPSYTFRGDEDTGVGLALADALSLIAGGVEGMRIAEDAGIITVTSNGNIYPGTDDTYYLGKNDDDSPFAWKGLIVKDTTDGKYYRIESINGVVTATDLTD